MAEARPNVAESSVQVVTRTGAELDRWIATLPADGLSPLHPNANPVWTQILRDGLNHTTFVLEAKSGGQSLGVLPLAFIKSNLFGKFLVSLPYINTACDDSASPAADQGLIDRAMALADEYDVRYLELRREREVLHPSLVTARHNKVLMRMQLPTSGEELLDGFKSKLRSQIRSGLKHDFRILWGGSELLNEFYGVFSRNMRDLGTPVYPRRLFQAILRRMAGAAELCVVKLQGRSVAAALLTHGRQTTEVPSASSLRQFNPTNANMVLYYHLLRRAIDRGQRVFDFGRSTMDSGTFHFKAQWGAIPSPSIWQYFVRRGSLDDMRPTNGSFSLAIRAWQRLPLFVANWLGPAIVRGIP